MDIMQNVEKVNGILLAHEPGNITTDEHAGYTGYRPQSIMDAMNEGFGIGKWGFEEVSSEIIAGDKGGLAIAQVQVWLAGIDFKPTSWGQNRVTRGDVGDAKKAAQTDAIKKGLSYFSIGNRAYHGLLDGKKQAQRPAPPQAKPVLQTVPAQPQAQDAQPEPEEVPVPSKLRAMFVSIGTSLETAEKLTFKRVKNDLELTPEECFHLHQVYDDWKKRYDAKQQKAS